MVDAEEYFPRGGKKPAVQYFKQSSNFLAAAEQGERKKKKQKRKAEGDDGYLSDEPYKDVDLSQRNCATGINYQTAKAGVTILGRVRYVMETQVQVMMPNKMMGFVMACHISEPYNKLLEAYVNDQTESVCELSMMFKPGQYVALKVLENKDRNLMMTMMPQHVNANLQLKDLHNGCIIQAAVSSVEDHGYVMDIGIVGTRAFMPKKSANPVVQLDVGYITWCCVKNSEAVVTLSSRLEDLQGAVTRRSPGVLLPGTGVDFTVDKPLDNGIEGHIFKDTTAYIQRNQADTVKGKKPSLGQRVRARVLYVMPTRQAPFVTMRNIFEAAHPDLDDEQKYKEGDIVDKAQVLKITGRSIVFKLGAGSTGTMSLRRVQVHEDLSDEDVIAKSYPLGSIHKVRVLCYNLCDYSYTVTDQSDVINEKYFSIDQFTVGQIVTGTVKHVTDTNVTVTLGRVRGLVPHAHITDAGIAKDPKKASNKLPKKKYKVGQEVTGRVLVLELTKGTVILTLKPTLLDPDLEVLQSYEQAEIGKAYTGVIKYISESYVVVLFFNQVTALVGRNNISEHTELNVTDAFHVGQIVSCTILRVDAEQKKMSGSFVTPPFWPNNRPEHTTKRKRNDSESKPQSTKKHKTDDDNQIEEAPRKKDKKVIKIVEETTDNVKGKKKNKSHETENEDDVQPEVTNKKARKKNKNKSDETEIGNSDNDQYQETESTSKKRKNKQTNDAHFVIENTKETKRKKDEKHSVSEESDAIETDLPDDSDNAISVQDLELLDLSECITGKKCKRKVVSLLKAIKARTKQIESLENQIQMLEEEGLNIHTKKQHTTLHIKKMVTEERLKNIVQTLQTAQGMLKSHGEQLGNKDYKKKKDTEKVTSNKPQKCKQHDSEPHKDKSNKNTDDPKSKANREKRVENEVKLKIPDVKVVESLEPALEVPSAKDFWSTSVSDTPDTNVQEESSSSDEEEQEQPKKKRKKLTVAEKLSKAREEEERVRELERRAIESESQPRSSDQFERALLANPDCSQLWIAYMAFHLQATEIEKARAVGRKALNTISFREEQERLNVWIALINCEHRFGNKESQQKTLEEALQKNDTFQVHSKLLDILVDTGKHQELVSLTDLMLKKYKRDPNAYMRAGDACYKLGLVDKARNVMQKAISVLEKKEHVSILVHFALLERTNAARERAEALFEQVLAVYPQRVDVCAVYVDMLVKEGDLDRVRQVMERMTSLKLPARKMKILFKKWIEIEEKLGDKSQVDTIKDRAMEFIEKAKF